MTTDTISPPAARTIDYYVGRYVQLRDLIHREDEAHKERMRPHKETLEKLNAVLLQHLLNAGVESARTNSGTVYRVVKKSASIADKEAFWQYVVANQAFDLIDVRANKTAVEDFVKDNNQLPPGVNFSSITEVGVRRK